MKQVIRNEFGTAPSMTPLETFETVLKGLECLKKPELGYGSPLYKKWSDELASEGSVCAIGAGGLYLCFPEGVEDIGKLVQTKAGTDVIDVSNGHARIADGKTMNKGTINAIYLFNDTGYDRINGVELPDSGVSEGDAKRFIRVKKWIQQQIAALKAENTQGFKPCS